MSERELHDKTDTPRTDGNITRGRVFTPSGWYIGGKADEWVPVETARQLERELAELQEECDSRGRTISMYRRGELTPSAVTFTPAEAALREGAAILLQVAEMEEHNERIVSGKWKKGSKAWSGDFIKRLRTDGMAKLRDAMNAAAPQAAGMDVRTPVKSGPISRADDPAVAAVPSAITFTPTHRHAEGGLYRFVSAAKYKPLTLDWSDAIIYEAEDRKLYVTTPARWGDRFTPIRPDSPAKSE